MHVKMTTMMRTMKRTMKELEKDDGIWRSKDELKEVGKI